MGFMSKHPITAAMTKAAKGANLAMRFPVDLAVVNLSPEMRFGLPRYYDMTVSDRGKYAWFQVAKVATQSIQPVLQAKTQVTITGGRFSTTR